jgi:hypothetical protein
MSKPKGHHAGRVFLGQDGNLYLNGGKLFAPNDVDLSNQLNHLGNVQEVTAAGTIKGNRLILGHTDGTFLEGTLGSTRIVGVNPSSSQVASTNKVLVALGIQPVVAAEPIIAGARIKCGDNGRVLNLNVADTTIGTGTSGNFDNDPDNDAVEVVSSSAEDEGIAVTIIGTTHGGVVTVSETVETDGTTAVETTKQDWGKILAVKSAGGHAGTLTIRKKTGPATITTLATGTNSAGVVVVAAASQGARGLAPYATAEASTTKTVGILYSPATGAADALQAIALNGTNKMAFAAAANLVKEIYIGHVETGRTATVKTNAVSDGDTVCVGKSLANIAAAATGVALVMPVN